MGNFDEVLFQFETNSKKSQMKVLIQGIYIYIHRIKNPSQLRILRKIITIITILNRRYKTYNFRLR